MKFKASLIYAEDNSVKDFKIKVYNCDMLLQLK